MKILPFPERVHIAADKTTIFFFYLFQDEILVILFVYEKIKVVCANVTKTLAHTHTIFFKKSCFDLNMTLQNLRDIEIKKIKMIKHKFAMKFI